jgi:hypothetical protein
MSRDCVHDALLLSFYHWFVYMLALHGAGNENPCDSKNTAAGWQRWEG